MKKILLLCCMAVTLSLLICGCKGTPDTESAPSLMAGEVKINNLIYTLPEGFTLTNASGIAVACCPEYPERTDNISFTTAEKDDPDNYTKESLDRLYSSIIAGFAGSTALDTAELAGCTVLIYSYNLVLNEVPFSATQYIVFGESFTDIITVTLSDTKYADAIGNSVAAAKLVK